MPVVAAVLVAAAHGLMVERIRLAAVGSTMAAPRWTAAYDRGPMLVLRGGGDSCETPAQEPATSASEWRLSAFAHLEAGAYESAAACLRRYLRLERDEEMLAVLTGIAGALSIAGEHEPALRSLRLALEMEPHDIATQEALITALRRAGRLREAAETCHSMLKSSGGAREACWLYHHLGGLIQELVPLPGTGLEWEVPDPSAAPPALTLGGAGAAQEGAALEETLTAEECYSRAAALDPSCGLVHKRLAEVQGQARGPRAAAVVWAIAARLLPDDICAATHHFYGAPVPRRLCPEPISPPVQGGTPDMQPADVEPGAGGGGSAVAGGRAGSAGPRGLLMLADVSVDPRGLGWEERAVATLEVWGVVVLPRLLCESACSALDASVAAADAAETTADLTGDTRDPNCRVHKALPLRGAGGRDVEAPGVAAADGSVDWAPGVGVSSGGTHWAQDFPLGVTAAHPVSQALASLFPVLSRVLRCAPGQAFPLLGAGWMRVSPGATDQPLHKDVPGHDRHGGVPPILPACDDAPRAVSIQIQLTDTSRRDAGAPATRCAACPHRRRGATDGGHPISGIRGW